MPTFHYKAKKKNAETVSGRVLAQSKDEAVEKISKLGLTPVQLNEDGMTDGGIARIASGKVKGRELYHFTRQLASLVKAGMTLLRSLEITKEQTSNRFLKYATSKLADGIRDGRAFSDCLTDYPQIFSSIYVSMIRAGEESGKLQEMLNSLADYQHKQNEIVSRMKAALTYPLIMLIVGIITVCVMLVYVMPKIMHLFIGYKDELPLATKMLLYMSNALSTNWAFVLIFIFSVTILFKRWIKTPAGQLAWSQFLLNIPVISQFYIKVEMARFSRTLELLLKSGVTIIKAMSLSIPLVGNEIIRRQLIQCQDDLTSGHSLGESIKKSNIIPSLLGDLISVGEESGALSEALEDVADAYEEETTETVKYMMTLLEPLMIILVGSAIAFCVFAILLPIFQMDVFR